jgi:hypothetical protein
VDFIVRDTSYTFFHTHKGKVHSARSFSAPMVALLKGAEERASNAPWQLRATSQRELPISQGATI